MKIKASLGPAAIAAYFAWRWQAGHNFWAAFLCGASAINALNALCWNFIIRRNPS